MKKPAWLYNQSGVIPYFIKDGSVYVVIITSSKKTKWIFPKGVVEKPLSDHESAAKEAMEEAGVKGKVENVALTSYTYEKWGGTCNVKLFPLKVETILDEYPEKEKRERKIIKLEDVYKYIYLPELLEAIKLLELKNI